MSATKIAANIAPRPNDGSGGIPASIYDDPASTDLAAVDAVDSAVAVSYTHLTLPTSNGV